MVIAKVEHANFIESDTLEASVRGDDGYGSTGIAGESEKGTEKPKKLFKDEDYLNEVKDEEVKPRYNVGDVVIIRNDLKPNTIYGGVKFVGSMNVLKNNIIKIDSINKRRFGRCIYNIADGWHLSEEMIDHKETEEFKKFCDFMDSALYGKRTEPNIDGMLATVLLGALVNTMK